MSMPPRWARWLIARALPPDTRDDIDGDLLEMFQRRVHSRGVAAARLWYWRQVLAFARNFGSLRCREWWQQKDMTARVSLLDVRLALRMQMDR